MNRQAADARHAGKQVHSGDGAGLLCRVLAPESLALSRSRTDAGLEPELPVATVQPH